MDRNNPQDVVAHLMPGLAPEEPFGGVAFAPERRTSDNTVIGAFMDTPSNGERACDGCTALELFAALGDPTGARSVLEEIADDISLTEAPDEALADLLTNLMHYCHREGIEWHGPDGVLATAVLNFTAESGGAAL